MGLTMPATAHVAPRKPLRMQGEAHPKPLRSSDFKRLIGRAIETALRASDIEKKTAAREMGYGDNQASLSNWIRGEETPQFAKLWELGDRFRQELVIALAEECQMGVKVRTVVELERRRA